MNHPLMFGPNLWRSLGSLLFIFSKYAVVLLLFSLQFHFDWQHYAIVYIPVAVFGLFDLVPALLIWVQYLLHSNKISIEFDSDQKRLIVMESPGSKFYDVSEIEQIEFVFSFGGNSGVYSFGEFYYWKITFRQNEQLILNCFSCTQKMYAEMLENSLLKSIPVPRLYPFLPMKKNS